MPASLTLIRGLPGSGKSTLAKKLKAANAFESYHFEADQFFMFNGEYRFNPEKLGEAHQWCQSQTEAALSAGSGDVIVSNTFTTVKELAPYFNMAKKYGIVPVVILCSNEFGSVHGVPDEAMKRMKDRFQHDISIMFF